jgi:hypothetical protein
LTLDLSASTGSGGRAWSGRSIRAETSASVDLSPLQIFLDTVYRPSPPTPIPSALLSKGVPYTFRVTLCNFLGKCGQSSKRVLVQASTVPVVSLPGSTLRRTKRSTALSVGSDAYYAQCGVTGVLRSGLSYSWAVSTNGAQLLNIDTTSRDPSKLLLPAYALQANVLYDITLKVTIIATQQSASAAVQVYVEPGEILPVVALGSSRTVRVEQSITIDASASYDQDQSGVTGTSAGLSFSWSCVQVSPVFQSGCTGVFSSAAASASQPAEFTVQALSSAADSVAQVTVTISDAGNARTASSVVTVTVQPSLSPVVSIASSASSSVVNSNQELSFTGTVGVPARYNGTATWSVDDTSSFTLKTAARSPLSNFIASSASVSQSQVYLVLAANSLPPGVTLTFLLSAHLPAAGVRSVASVTVTVNAPPQPGSFLVTPPAGTEIVDPFTFLADQWFDADLPMLYQFTYVTAGGVEMTVRSKAEAAFATAMLPAGSTGSNFTVTCAVQVLDALSAPSFATASVQVRKTAVARSASETADIISTSLSAVGDNVDDLKQATALGSYLLNDVDCSQAPNCTERNRAECSQTTQTCGSCLSVLYVGEEGDSNEHCILASSVSGRRLAAIGTACLADGDCGLFQSCADGLCSAEPKECKANCSAPQGACGYVDVNSGAPLTACFMGDTSCKAVCTCTAEYVGSETCSLTVEELAQKQALREQVVQGIQSILRLEDPDRDTVVGWINSLTIASQAPDELSAAAITSLLNAVQTVQQSGTSSGVGASTLSGILASINAAAQAVANTQLPGRRRLDDADSAALVLHTTAALDNFRAYASAQLLPGQDPVTAVYPQFRMHVENRAISAGAGSAVSVSLPQSSIEASVGAAVSSVTLPVPAQSARSAMRVSVSSLSSQLLNDELGLTGYQRAYSNPLALEFAGLPCAEASSCSYEVTLQTASMAAALLQRSPVEFFRTACASGDTSTQTHACANGREVSITCDGTAGTASIQCPIQYLTPACSALDGLSVGSSGCAVNSQTDTSITCTCPVPAADRRLLAAANGTSTIQTVNYVGMLSEVEDTFVATIVSADDLSVKSLEKGWSVLLTIGLFAAVVIFGLHWSYNADLESTKIKPAIKDKAEKMLDKEVRRKQVWKLQRGKKGAATGDLRIAEEALPVILGSGSLTSKVTDEMKYRHKWFGVIFYYSKSFPRVLRVISLATNVLVMLFIQSLTYALTNPDDGTCESMTTQEDCLGPQSPYATGESKCYWDADHVGKECMLVQPDSAAMVIVFVAIFSAVVSVPLALLVDWIVLHILASPLKQPAITAAATATSSGGAMVTTSMANLFGAVGAPSISGRTRSSSSSRRLTDFRLSSLFGVFDADTASVVSSAKLQAQADMRRLVSKIEEYRRNLSQTDKQEFDGKRNCFAQYLAYFNVIPMNFLTQQRCGAWTRPATSARTRSCGAGCTR